MRNWTAFFLLLATGIAAIKFAAGAIPSAAFWLDLDFYPAYIGAGLLGEGGNPYDATVIGQRAAESSVIYIPGNVPGATPFWVWLFQGFHQLGMAPRAAATTWFVLSLVACCTGIATCSMLLKDSWPDRRHQIQQATRVLAVLFLPLYGTLLIGQSTAFVFCLISLAALLLHRGRCYSAASFIALAATAKIFPIGLAALFVLRRRPRAAFLCVGLFLAMQAPAVLQRPSIVTEFVVGAAEYSAVGDESQALVVANQSLWGAALRLTSENEWSVHIASVSSYFVFAVSAVLLWMWTLLTLRTRIAGTRAEELRVLLMLLVCTSVSAPYLWHHAYLVLFPAYLYVVVRRPLVGWLCVGLVALQHLHDQLPHPPLVIQWIPPATALALISALIVNVVIGNESNGALRLSAARSDRRL